MFMHLFTQQQKYKTKTALAFFKSHQFQR